MNNFKNIYRYKSVLKYHSIYKTNGCFPVNQIQTRNCSKSSKNSSNLQLGDIGTKYKPFREEDSEIILDVCEEKLKYSNDLLEEAEDYEENTYIGLNMQRGTSGVYDIEDLVELLKRENSLDIFVAHVPSEHNYVDYIAVVTGKSKRHMQAIAQFVRRVYKQKKHKTDLIPKIEGENSSEWIAMDLGNIALHIFSTDARTYYDLDSLWAVGPEYDKEFNKKDDIVEMLEKHSMFLKDLQPA